MDVEESAGVILISEHEEVPKALIIRVRVRELYEIPKGHIEDGETAEIAALRELREETGVDVPVMLGPYLGDLEYRFKSFGKRVHKRVQYFLGIVEPGVTPVFGNVLPLIREIRWASNEEVAELRFVSKELKLMVHRAFELAGEK